MKKTQLSILISTLLLGSTALATNESLNSGNEVKQSYSVIAPEQQQLGNYSGTLEAKVEQRLAQISSLQAKVADRLNQLAWQLKAN